MNVEVKLWELTLTLRRFSGSYYIPLILSFFNLVATFFTDSDYFVQLSLYGRTWNKSNFMAMIASVTEFDECPFNIILLYMTQSVSNVLKCQI